MAPVLFMSTKTPNFSVHKSAHMLTPLHINKGSNAKVCAKLKTSSAQHKDFRESNNNNNNIFPVLLYFLHSHLSPGLGTSFISYYDYDNLLAR